MAALSEGEITLHGVLFSDDSRYFLSSLGSLGYHMSVDEEKCVVKITGNGAAIPKNSATINVGSAGTAARFLTAMLAFSDGEYVVNCSEQMKRRPMLPLFEMLEKVGAKITYLENEGFLPVKVEGCMRGRGDAPLGMELDISKSTQFLSAVLLISPMIRQGLNVHITSEKTDGSYIRITTKMMRDAGVEVAYDGRNYSVAPDSKYNKNYYDIEPDVSAACYFYAAAAISGGKALVQGVHSDNSQGDMRFLEVLRGMGCTVVEEPEGISVCGPAGGRLRSINVNMNDFSDQALTLAAIALFADGPVTIEGLAHIRGQECDRLHAMATELIRAGIECDEREDSITIYPGTPKPCVIETYNDHRVAMAFSLLGLKTDGIVIDNPDCCRKTFEGYFDVLDGLCRKEE
jgi:3-phosphoshikimate 1-carboxyvinyltransferase